MIPLLPAPPQPFLLPAHAESTLKLSEEEIGELEDYEEEESDIYGEAELVPVDKDTSSWKQPIAPGPIFEIEEYSVKGGKALSIQSNMRHEAAYYQEDPKYHKGYGVYGWDSTGPSEYVKATIHNAQEAIETVERFVLPDHIRREANRASRHLVSVFEKVAAPLVLNDLTSGRINRKRIPEVVMKSAAGTYDVNEVRPYRKTLPTPSKTPTLAVVADASNYKMWGDPEYIPRILKITLGILWACEAAGLKTYAALTEGNMDHVGYKEAIWVHIIAEPDRAIPLNMYAALLHRDLWRWAGISAEAADHTAHETFCKIEGMTALYATYGTTYSSYDGGNAVNWAKSKLGADVVIAIGEITDKSKAEIQLSSKFSINDAVRQIVIQAKKLERK